jgi:hypothetical protein
MIPIPGFIIAIATFPGVIIHELAHLLFCRLKRVPVLEVKFFQFNMQTAGYVLHGPVESFGASFLVSVGPFIVNSLLCMLICLPASIPYRLYGSSNFPTLVLLWLGVSIGMHAFPSTQDASNLSEQAKKAVAAKNKAAYLAYPVVGLIYLANLLSVIWFDALYGFFIGIILPSWILGAL